jgi:hypothetical protein
MDSLNALLHQLWSLYPSAVSQVNFSMLQTLHFYVLSLTFKCSGVLLC